MEWDIYEVSSKDSPLQQVMFRGRVRKFCLVNGINVLTENSSDDDNRVRFAVLSGENVSLIIEFINKIIPHTKVEKVMAKVKNPVLSKLKINLDERYSI